MSENYLEKRKYPRADAKLPVYINNVTCRTINISGGGMLVVFPADIGLQLKEIVFSTFYLDEQKRGDQVSVKMAAMHKTGTVSGTVMIGFEFTEIAESVRNRIIELVDDLLKSKSKVPWWKR